MNFTHQSKCSYLFQLGNVLTTILLSAFRKGLDIEKFHVVGHSLGAQMAGVIGRKIISKSNQSQKLKRFRFHFVVIFYRFVYVCLAI